MNAITNKEIQDLANKELESANKQFPLFQSRHEGYAVLLEEFEELATDFTNTAECIDYLWLRVKGNNNDLASNVINELKERIVSLTKESIQLLAMCDKWNMSFEGKDDER